MVCNHCTRGTLAYVSTNAGPICVKCRDEICSAETRKDDPPYPFCSQPEQCTPLGYCLRDPNCCD